MTFVELTPAITPPVTQLEEIKPIKQRIKRASKHDFKDGRGRVFAHKHDNGKGWVEDTAKVADNVYVGPRAQVYQYATVTGTCKLEGQSMVFGHADINGVVTLKKNARVYGRAVLRDNVRLEDSAKVFDNAAVGGSSQLFGMSQVREHARVIASALYGFCDISGEANILRSNFHGNIGFNNRAVAINATIWGRVSFNGYSQILNSTITLPDNSPGILLSAHDFASIIDSSQISVPMMIRQHVVIVRSVFMGNDWRNATDNNGTVAVEGQLVVAQRRFSSYSDLANWLRAPNSGAVQSQNGQINAHTHNGVTRGPISVQPAARRVMRLETATTT